MKKNIGVEWITLVSIPVICASYLVPDTGCLTEGLNIFPQSLQTSILNYTATATFHIVSNSLFIIHRIVRRYII